MHICAYTDFIFLFFFHVILFHLFFYPKYVTLQIGDETDTTQVIDKNLNPEWNASFDHKIDPKNPPNDIQFTCWDKDIFGRDYMGEITVSLLKLWESGTIGYHSESNKVDIFLYSNSLLVLFIKRAKHDRIYHYYYFFFFIAAMASVNLDPEE